MRQLTVVIVTYNAKQYLLKCLEYLGKASEGMDVEVIVVDNASADGSEEAVRDAYPNVEYIYSTENLGFAKANNIAIRKASGKYVLLLNPDVFISEDTLRRVLEFAESKPDMGALGVRMINSDGVFLPESKRNKPTLWNSFCKITGLASLMPESRLFASYYNVTLSENETGYTSVLAGAFMLLNKAALGDTSLLCEDYFMYGEDIDLSVSVLDAGYRNYYCGDVTVVHLKGKCTDKASPKIIEAFYKSMDIYYRRHSKNPIAKAIVRFITKATIRAKAGA